MATQKKQSFFGGAAVLAIGIAVVKVIGALFKIPLANVLGEAGMADFTNAYNIYATFLTISTAGLPIALSKMVSEATTLNRLRQSRRIFRVSFAAFLTLGIVSFAIMWWGNELCANLLHNPHAALGIRALAPAVICVGCLSAFRGYAQGCFHMTPTAVSQIIESLCKLLVGLALASWLLASGFRDYEAAAGAITGVTCGTILSLIYMIIDYFLHRPKEMTNDIPDSKRKTLRRLLAIAIPITLSSSMVSIITLIDTSLVQKQLQSIGYTLNETRRLYGTYSSGMNLYNLPSSLMVALTASVIPAVSASLAKGNHKESLSIISSSLRVTALLSFPMGLGLWALSTPIMKLFYPKYDCELGGSLLAVLGIASIFVCLMLISNSILQSYNRMRIPIFTMLIGGMAKIVINYILVGNPAIHIHGAPIGTMICFIITAVLNLIIVAHTMQDSPHYFEIFTKPLLASVAMAVCAKLVYNFMSLRFTTLISVAAAIVIAAVFYLALVFLLKIITREDLLLLPKGEKIAKIFHVQ